MAEVPIADAARRLGLSYDTVRRRIRKGELVGRQERRRQGLVWLVELPDAVPADAPASGQGAPTAPEMTAGEVLAFREHNATLREQLAARTREVQELHVLLQGLEPVLPSPRQEPEHAGAGAEVMPPHIPRWQFWRRREVPPRHRKAPCRATWTAVGHKISVPTVSPFRGVAPHYIGSKAALGEP
ncbi:MAG: AsnC family protein [Dehalococcoidia bacterium]